MKSVSKRFVLICFLWCVFGLFLAADNEPFNLQTLIDEALTRNPTLKSLEKEKEAASFRIKPAQTLPDPMVELGVKNMGLNNWMVGKDPSSGIVLSFSQVFPLFGKLKLAGNMARNTILTKQNEIDSAKLDVIRQIKTAYFELYSLYRSVEILEKQKDLLQKALALSETRYSVGSGLQNDIFKAELEISRMDEMIIPMSEMIKSQEARINLLLDFPPDKPLGKPAALAVESMDISYKQLEEQFLQYSPKLKESHTMEIERDLMVQMARKDFKPDVKVSSGWEFKGKLTGMFELMLGLEIPLYAKRKQSERLKESRMMMEKSKLDTLSMKNGMLSELNEYYVKAKTAENLIRLYKTRIIPQANLALEASFTAYPVNKTDFMSLIQDISSLFSAQLALHRELSQLWSAMAEIESITGVPLLNPKEIQ